MKQTRRRQGNGSAGPPVSGSSVPALTPAKEVRYTIGGLAKDLDITTRTIRFYESKGLIAPERKGVARIYSRRDRARLLLILRGKNLGFSLEDVKEYLELYDADPTRVAQMKLLESKLDVHIATLKQKRADIDRTLKELQDMRATVAAQLAERDQSPE